MSPAIRVENLGKRYRLGQTHSGSIREALGRGLDRLLGRGRSPLVYGTPAHDGRRDGENSFWALREVSFEVDPGEAVGSSAETGRGSRRY